MRLQKRLNIALTIALTTAFILLGIFTFRQSYCRTIEALIDLYGGFKYYFCVLFGLPTDGLPSVTDYSKIMEWTVILPSDFESFKVNVITYFSMLFSKENFLLWLSATGAKASVWAKVLTILLPCFLVLIIAIKRMYASGNTKHNVDTIPLRVFKKISAVTYQPTKRFICGYIDFLREHSWIWISWAVMWAFHLNLASIVIEFFAYYFFFAVSFRADTIYTQFVKLARDLQPFFRFFPWWSLLIICYVLFERWRKKVALNKLRKCEAKNCGFINALPIVSMTCGSMGKRKTTMITDMALSQEVMFRQKAFEILQKADMKFPYFPWICFEKELAACMEYGTVYNLATVKEWVNLKHSRFEKHGNALWQLYGYDCQRYGLTYNDALKTSELFDVLETYAQAFFIYALQTSLIVANYSIRTDNRLLSEDNFPLWALDFFSDGQRRSRHSHILDFDVLRLGKKVLENNPKVGSFEFGVVAITEIGKERGNNLELREVKKKNDETNQKNDLFNSWLKMCRHSAIAENVKLGKPDATDEEVAAALHAAQCDDIIQKFPDGAGTTVGTKGVYLSGGERQRIAIARAVLKNAPVIILDEATAFADPDNEAKVQKAFSELSKGKTVIMIAHRLSTVADADCIYVIKDGLIAESGRRDELLEKNGVFAEMWKEYAASVEWKVAKEGKKNVAR